MFLASCSSWLPSTNGTSGDSDGSDSTSSQNLIPVSLSMSAQTTQAIASAIPQISQALPAALPALKNKHIKKESDIDMVIMAALSIPKSLEEILNNSECILKYDVMTAEDFINGGSFSLDLCEGTTYHMFGIAGYDSVNKKAEVWVEANIPKQGLILKGKDNFNFGELSYDKKGGLKMSDTVLSDLESIVNDIVANQTYTIPQFLGEHTLLISNSGASVSAESFLKQDENKNKSSEKMVVSLCSPKELSNEGDITIIMDNKDIITGEYAITDNDQVTIAIQEEKQTLVKGCNEIIVTKAVFNCQDNECSTSEGVIKELSKLEGNTCKNKQDSFNVVSKAFTATKKSSDCLLTSRATATGTQETSQSLQFPLKVSSCYGSQGPSWTYIDSSKIGGYIEKILGKNPETIPLNLVLQNNDNVISYSIKGTEISGKVTLTVDSYGSYGSYSGDLSNGPYELYLYSYLDYISKSQKMSGSLAITNASKMYSLESDDDVYISCMFAEEPSKTQEMDTYSYNDYATATEDVAVDVDVAGEKLTSDLCASSYQSGNISDFSQAMQNEINALDLFLPEDSKYSLGVEITSSEAFTATLTASNGNTIVLNQDDFSDTSYYSYTGGWSLSAWSNFSLSDGYCYVSFYVSMSSYSGKEEFWPSYSISCSSSSDWSDYYYRYLASDSYTCSTAQQTTTTTTTTTYTETTYYNSYNYYGYESEDKAQEDFNSGSGSGTQTYQGKIEASAYSYSGGTCSGYTGSYEVEVKMDGAEAAIKMKKPDGKEVYYKAACTESYGYKSCSYYNSSPYDSVWFSPPYTNSYYSSDPYFSYYGEVDSSCSVSVYGALTKQ